VLKFLPGAVVEVRAGRDEKVLPPTPWEGVGSGSCMVVFMVFYYQNLGDTPVYG